MDLRFKASRISVLAERARSRSSLKRAFMAILWFFVMVLQFPLENQHLQVGNTFGRKFAFCIKLAREPAHLPSCFLVCSSAARDSGRVRLAMRKEHQFILRRKASARIRDTSSDLRPLLHIKCGEGVFGGTISRRSRCVSIPG